MADGDRTLLVVDTTSSQETCSSCMNYGDNPIFGQYKTWKHFSRWEKIFYIITTVLKLLGLGATVCKLATLPRHLDDYTFAIIMFVTSLFCLFYFAYGMHKESWPHIVANCITSLFLGIYSFIRWKFLTMYFVEEEIGIQVRLFASVVYTFISVWFAYKAVTEYRHNGWRVCTARNSENDGSQKIRLTWFYICRCLITFELQIQITVLFFVLENGMNMTLEEKILLFTGLHATFVWALAGFATIHEESLLWLTAFALLWIRSLAYIVYKAVRMPYLAPFEQWTALYQATFACLVLNVISKLALIGTLYRVVRDFRKDANNTQQPTNHSAGDPESLSSSLPSSDVLEGNVLEGVSSVQSIDASLRTKYQHDQC